MQFMTASRIGVSYASLCGASVGPFVRKSRRLAPLVNQGFTKQMIANIHDDGEPSLGASPRHSTLTRSHRAEAFSDFYGDDDAMFRRLGRNVTASRVWIRSSRDLYDIAENPVLLIPAGTLCQIGVHLVPDASQRGGRFCQIVSGPHRGLRFEFKAEDFFHADDNEE